MKLLSAIIAGIGVLIGIVPNCNGAVCKGKLTLKAEIPTIRKAAERNGIKYGSDDWYLLLAIRKAENGSKFREFGILHPKCDRIMQADPNNTLDIQAGWAAATVMKHHKRFGSDRVNTAFINSLGDRYCPEECDPEGNKNWKRNVKYWFKKLREEKLNDESKQS